VLNNYPRDIDGFIESVAYTIYTGVAPSFLDPSIKGAMSKFCRLMSRVYDIPEKEACQDLEDRIKLIRYGPGSLYVHGNLVRIFYPDDGDVDIWANFDRFVSYRFVVDEYIVFLMGCVKLIEYSSDKGGYELWLSDECCNNVVDALSKMAEQCYHVPSKVAANDLKKRLPKYWS
jgi:hypothetical protein